MESQHVINPWLLQHHQRSHKADSNCVPPHPPLTSESEPKTPDDFFYDRKEVFYHLQQQHRQRRQEKDDHPHDEDGEGTETTIDAEETANRCTWPQLGIESPLNHSTATLNEPSSPSATTLLGQWAPTKLSEDPVVNQEITHQQDPQCHDPPQSETLEHLVHELQSEVVNSRATVFDLESRLNLAENSNKYIVEELQTLLAQAEETLGSGAVEISSSGVILLTDKRKAGADEDSNAVYNRICTTLQSLIDEAQSALQKSDTPTSPTNPSNGQDTKAGSSVLTPKGREGDAPLRPLSSIRTRTLNSSGVGTSPLSSPTTANRRNPRDSFSRFDNNDHERISRPPMFKSFETDDPLSLYNPWESTYAGTSEVSRIYWRQKHEEQHDRYRKSCQRVTLELEQRFYNTSTDSDDSEAPSERSAVSTTLSAIGLGPSSSLARDTRPLHRSSSSVSLPLRSSLRKSGSKSERLKKKYQVQFLNLQPLDPMESSATTASASTSTSTPTSTSGSSPSTSSSSKRDDRYELTSRQRDHQVQRSVKHQSVGSNRSRGVVLQLYELWQQTWLRTRIMHVIAGSVEVVIIIWIVIRASRATLTWFGIQPKTFSEWLSFAYNRQWRITGGSSSMASSSSAAAVGTTAKEIYAKIRKDGIRLRHVHMWNQGEPEALVEDVVMGMKVGSSPGLTPSNVIYGPAKKVLIHAATGVVLACLSDGARRLARKL